MHNRIWCGQIYSKSHKHTVKQFVILSINLYRYVYVGLEKNACYGFIATDACQTLCPQLSNLSSPYSTTPRSQDCKRTRIGGLSLRNISALSYILPLSRPRWLSQHVRCACVLQVHQTSGLPDNATGLRTSRWPICLQQMLISAGWHGDHPWATYTM